MATPCNPLPPLVGSRVGTWAWRWLFALGVVLLVTGCGPRPNRLEILRHKKEVLAGRQDKDRFFKSSPQSPLLDEQQWKFKALSYFPVDIAYRVTARYQPLTKPVEFRIRTSSGHERIYSTIGRLDFTLAGKPLTLMAYQEKSSDSMVRNALFVPFTDRTTGKETYGAGRYLDIEAPVGNTVVVDFNLAYNPYCAYNYNFSCPIPPAENRLDLALEAGEKIFPLGQPNSH